MNSLEFFDSKALIQIFSQDPFIEYVHGNERKILNLICLTLKCYNYHHTSDSVLLSKNKLGIQ